VATPTLAMGVNLPADTVIIVDHEFWQGYDRPALPLTIPTYRNMAGRAGRMLPNGPHRGTALLVARSKHEQSVLWDQLLAHAPQSLRSDLALLEIDDLALTLLQLRSDASPVDLVEDLADTFWGFTQAEQPDWSLGQRRKIEGALAVLEGDGLVVQVSPGRWRLTSLGNLAAMFSIRAESARRVRHAAESIITAGEPIDAFALLTIVQVAVEMDEVLMPKGWTSTTEAPRPFANRAMLWQVLTAPSGPTAAQTPNGPGDRLHRVLALLHWGKGRPLKEMENIYGRSVDSASPVASLFRSMVDRTGDLLPGIAALIGVVRPEYMQSIRAILPNLRNRLAVGGDEVVAQLYAMRLGLSRGECRALVGLGIDAANLRESLETCSNEIEAIISTPRTLDIRRQIADSRTTRRRSGQTEQLIFAGLDDSGAF
jgi:replicative superfamily II helicase